MRCYKCGGTISDSDVCPQCGADVSVYKKAAKASNSYYNLGLSKAKVRDLTGAIESLKMSITINKHNIDARNLLGLVYCEMGDVVEALSQWVISKNMKTEDNVANAYIAQIQSNQGKFEMVTATIKKFNLALRYAKEGNYDMATIQLKKIIAQNPKLLKAHQLLALLYMKDSEYGKARKQLNSVIRIDRNNTLANLYLKEIDEVTLVKKKENQGSFLPLKKERKADRDPLTGNDVIMPRSTYKEPSNGAITVINVLVGVVLGAALIWFLIMPARNKGITEEYNKSIQEYSEQLSSGNVELNTVTKELESVKKDKDALEEKLSEISGDNGSNKLLTAVIDAANAYIANNTADAAGYLVDVDISSLPSDSAKKLYTTLAEATMSSASKEFYSKGMQEFNKKNYQDAADNFVKSYKCDNTQVDAVAYAAKSYVSLSDTDNAKKYYQIIVDEFKTSSYYSDANTFVTSH